MSDTSQLNEAVAAFEFMGFDWRRYGEELGLTKEHLDGVVHDKNEMDCKEEIESVLRCVMIASFDLYDLLLGTHYTAPYSCRFLMLRESVAYLSVWPAAILMTLSQACQPKS